MTPILDDEVISRLRFASRRDADDHMPSDDAFQNMALLLLKNREQVADKTAAKKVMYARWGLRHQKAKLWTYNRRVRAMPIVVDDDGGEVELTEFIAAEGPSPEEEAERAEEQREAAQVVNRAKHLLTPHQRRVMELMLAGLRQFEIAAQLAITESAVALHKKKIEQALRTALSGQVGEQLALA